MPTSRTTASKSYSNLLWTWSARAPPYELDHCLEVHLQIHWIIAFNYISKFTRSRPPSSHDLGLQKLITKLSRSWPPSASSNSLNFVLQVCTIMACSACLHTRSITASKCISKLAWSGPQSASLSSLDHGLYVYLQTGSITTSACISNLAPSPPQSVSHNSLNHSVVNCWGWNAYIPSSTLRRTSPGIRKEFMRKSGSDSRSVGSVFRGYEGIPSYDEQHKLGGSMSAWQECIMNLTNCVDLWKLGKSVWRQELGKRECVFCIMGRCLSTLGSAKYRLPVAESISIIPVSRYVYLERDSDNTCHIMM